MLCDAGGCADGDALVLSSTIAPGQHLVVCPQTQTQWIGESDTITLVDSGGVEVDKVTLGGDGAFGKTWARLPDASGLFRYTFVPTPGAPYAVVAAGLQINEVADKGDPDDRCAGADWVELRNPTPGQLPLEGLVLSDDKGPSDADALILGAAGCPLALSAGELLLLCREGAASVGGASFAGCGFAFGIGGEDAVSLHAVDGALVDEVVGCCSGDAGSSYGRPEGGGGGFAVLPRRTPGAPNPAAGVLQDLVFTPSRGWADRPFDLIVACPGGGCSVTCTVDGSDPKTPATPLAAEGPSPLSILVDPARLYDGRRPYRAPAVTVRCVGRVVGLDPSPTSTHTYIFPDSVLDQAEGLKPGGRGVFWSTAMDSSPQLLNAENSSRAEMIAALASLPTVSISMAPDELFGLRGIHRGQNLETEDLEYACSMELMYPDTPRWRGHDGIQTPAGIRIQGGGARWHEGRNDAKQSFGLRFRGMYGASKLNYPVFESAPLNAASATDKFDKLILRAGHNKGWACDWDPANTVYTRDQFTRDLQIAMSGYGVHGTFVLLYLNGLFWGLYNLVERADHAYQASYFGGNEDDYYSGKKKGGTIRGSRAAYTSLHRSSARLRIDQVSAQLDVVSYIDQALLASYAAIGDYPQYYLWKPAHASGPHPLLCVGCRRLVGRRQHSHRPV